MFENIKSDVLMCSCHLSASTTRWDKGRGDSQKLQGQQAQGVQHSGRNQRLCLNKVEILNAALLPHVGPCSGNCVLSHPPHTNKINTHYKLSPKWTSKVSKMAYAKLTTVNILTSSFPSFLCLYSQSPGECLAYGGCPLEMLLVWLWHS